MENRNTPRTKIALVANSTWNIYNFRLNLVKEFERLGCDILVIAPVDEYIHYLNEASNIRHIPLRSLSRKSTNPLRDARLTFELYRIYRREQPDVIIHYTIKPNIFGNLAARMTRIKSICVVTGLGYTFLNEGLTKKISQLLYRFSFRYSAKVVFENQDDRQLFVERGLVATEQSRAFPGCGVNTSFFRPSRQARKQEHLRFLFVGRLLYDKGIVEFVEAAKIIRQQFPEVEFWVVGELDSGNPSAISKAQLVNWIDQKYIYYHGTTTDIRAFIRQVDVIVLPSYREGLPKVILEGMSMGKPVITTLTAGCKETVEDGRNGFLVPIKDSQALAQVITKVLQMDDIDREVMGHLSRKKALAEFDDRLIVNAYLELINALLPSSKQVSTSKSAPRLKTR